jgi:diguanylate cyclase (GGDEF)-like protein
MDISHSDRWSIIRFPHTACYILFTVGVFLFSLIGILSRPSGELATIWPANAFILGMMLRIPALAKPLGWLSAGLGFVIADAVGSGFSVDDMWPNCCNLVSIAVAYLMLHSASKGGDDFGRPAAFLKFLSAVVVGSLAAGVASVMLIPQSGTGGQPEAIIYWAASELVNYIALLPVFMYFPSPARRADVFLVFGRRLRWQDLLPIGALLISQLAIVLIGSPAAIALVIPALLWCAGTYDRFFLALISFTFIIWSLIAIRQGYVNVGGPIDSDMDVVATRMGVALVALVPLFVAAAIAMNTEMRVRLRGVAELDRITGLSNRRAFMEHGARFYEQSRRGGSTPNVALLLMEIDELKDFVRRHGSMLQIQALKEFGQILRPMTTDDILCGRLGNEGFGALLVGFDDAAVTQIAEHIKQSLGDVKLVGPDGQMVALSASIGIATTMGLDGGAAGESGLKLEPDNFAAFMGVADQALRRVKAAGGSSFGFAGDGDEAEGRSVVAQ